MPNALASLLRKRFHTMANAHRQLSALRQLLAVLLLATGTPLAQFSRADIVLDDFTDTAIGQIARGSGGFVDTTNVGELRATRQIRIAAGGNDVSGSFDINVAVPGVLSAQIQEIQRTIPGTPLTAVQFEYVFNPMDVTEGGRNDGILVDLAELVGDTQPTFLRAWVFDDTNVGSSFILLLRPLVPNDSPHTLAMPFDSFTLRNGAPGVPDAKTLREIRFDFFFAGHQGELNWSARIERIRFGSTVVPEPDAITPFWVGVVMWGRFRRARKGVPKCLSIVGNGTRQHSQYG